MRPFLLSERSLSVILLKIVIDSTLRVIAVMPFRQNCSELAEVIGSA
ncbi:hypothetical protein [Hoeflea sp.]|nr:hypothetical protein [Hoeflea sp.]MBC7284483.1 hypothetical protein [Hoeflea sp.]